ncbi:MAG: alpha/beta hydrolase [Betaproteobacteria bacterium]|nr:alpha/beta hydrolase [Betaproteobacteria bacterium]
MPHPAHLPHRLLFWLLLLPILLGTGCMLQDHLLYYPERISAAQVAASYPGLRPWPAASDLRGYLVEPRVAPRGTVVVFHGNAGHAAQRQWYAQELVRQGLRVLLAEYPGYGPRPGKPGEEALVADARESLRVALSEFGSPLLVIGESLGAAVAAGAVGGHGDEVAGLILITPWDRLVSVAQHHYPLLPVALFLRDTYDSAARLQDFPGPSVVVLAQEDRIIPAEIGRRLFATLPGEEQLIEIPHADHNDWPVHVDAAWWSRLIEILVPPR